MWRPPRTMNERAMRAIRSMQNGSMDGTVVSAKPVGSQPLIPESEYEFEDEVIDPEGPTPDTPLEPWTDVFTVGSNPSYVFTLSKRPYIQKKMEIKNLHPSNRATVHIQWNSVFQKDLSYSLKGKTLYLYDTQLSLKKGDKITVKYWFIDGGGDSSGDPEDRVDLVVPLDVWCSSYVSNFGGALYQNGFVTTPTVGVNPGTVTFLGYAFTNLFLGESASITYRYRLPKGLDLSSVNTDTHDFTFSYFAEEAMTTKANNKIFNPNATVPTSATVLNNQCHGLWSAYFPPQLDPITTTREIYPPMPSPHRVGGIVFAESEDAEEIFKRLRNIAANPNAVSQGESIQMWPFQGMSTEGGSGCRGCQCCWNSGLWEGAEVCTDDTPRSYQARINANWNARLGVTLYITPK